VRYLPEWFPGAKFKKLGRVWGEEVERWRCYPFAVGKRYLVYFCNSSSTIYSQFNSTIIPQEKGNTVPSALSLMLQTLNESKDEKRFEGIVRDLTATAFGGA